MHHTVVDQEVKKNGRPCMAGTPRDDGIAHGVGCAGILLDTMIEQVQTLGDRLAEMAARNEALALEVGTLRERLVHRDMLIERMESERVAIERDRDEARARIDEVAGELERENGAIVERITHVSFERDQAVHDKAAAEAERDALRAEVERWRAAQDAPVEPQEAPQGAESANAADTTPRPWWRFWER